MSTKYDPVLLDKMLDRYLPRRKRGWRGLAMQSRDLARFGKSLWLWLPRLMLSQLGPKERQRLASQVPQNIRTLARAYGLLFKRRPELQQKIGIPDGLVKALLAGDLKLGDLVGVMQKTAQALVDGQLLLAGALFEANQKIAQTALELSQDSTLDANLRNAIRTRFQSAERIRELRAHKKQRHKQRVQQRVARLMKERDAALAPLKHAQAVTEVLGQKGETQKQLGRVMKGLKALPAEPRHPHSPLGALLDAPERPYSRCVNLDPAQVDACTGEIQAALDKLQTDAISDADRGRLAQRDGEVESDVARVNAIALRDLDIVGQRAQVSGDDIDELCDQWLELQGALDGGEVLLQAGQDSVLIVEALLLVVHLLSQQYFTAQLGSSTLSDEERGDLQGEIATVKRLLADAAQEQAAKKGASAKKTGAVDREIAQADKAVSAKDTLDALGAGEDPGLDAVLAARDFLNAGAPVPEPATKTSSRRRTPR